MGLVHGISEKSYQKRSFLILRKEKIDFKRKKLKFFKGPKNKLFLRGSVHGFCPKIELIIITFFTEIMPEKVVFCYFK